MMLHQLCSTWHVFIMLCVFKKRDEWIETGISIKWVCTCIGLYMVVVKTIHKWKQCDGPSWNVDCPFCNYK